MYLPGDYNFEDCPIVKGATFNLPMTWKDGNGNPFNLNGWTAQMPIADLTGASIRTLSTASGEIVLANSSASPNITLAITAAVTATFSVQTATYQLLLTDGSGNITRLLQGRIPII